MKNLVKAMPLRILRMSVLLPAILVGCGEEQEKDLGQAPVSQVSETDGNVAAHATSGGAADEISTPAVSAKSSTPPQTPAADQPTSGSAPISPETLVILAEQQYDQSIDDLAEVLRKIRDEDPNYFNSLFYQSLRKFNRDQNKSSVNSDGTYVFFRPQLIYNSKKYYIDADWGNPARLCDLLGFDHGSNIVSQFELEKSEGFDSMTISTASGRIERVEDASNQGKRETKEIFTKVFCKKPKALFLASGNSPSTLKGFERLIQMDLDQRFSAMGLGKESIKGVRLNANGSHYIPSPRFLKDGMEIKLDALDTGTIGAACKLYGFTKGADEVVSYDSNVKEEVIRLFDFALSGVEMTGVRQGSPAQAINCFSTPINFDPSEWLR